MTKYKKILIFIFLVNLTVLRTIFSQSFLYPVDYDQKNNLIYILHQKSVYEINLWLWNVQDKTIQKALISTYIPASIKIVPGNNAFSFIDQGRLRIKELNKRSPKSIEFFEPISDINIIHWLNDQDFYFSVRGNRNFIICKSNIKEIKITTIVQKNEVDCIYPQIVSDHIFYIERDVNEDFGPIKSNYRIVKKDLKNDKEEIISYNNNSIAFLSIDSFNEGFYLEHQNKIDRKEKLINFKYHHIYYDDIWKDEVIFEFKLPISYIFGTQEQRFYESILPFIPKRYRDKIFFSNAKNNSIDIYSYDIIQKKTEKKTNALSGQIFFSPVFIENKCFYGYCHEEDEINDLKLDKLLPSFYI